MTQQHGLTWSELDFADDDPTEDGYVISALADGSEFGNPDPVVEIVASLLTDGALAVTQRSDNREVAIRLQIDGLGLTLVPAQLCRRSQARGRLMDLTPAEQSEAAAMEREIAAYVAQPSHRDLPGDAGVGQHR